MKRYKKDSFYWYKKVIETNGQILEEDYQYEEIYFNGQ